MKPPSEELSEEIAKDLPHYLMNGLLGTNAFETEDILNIDNLEKLLRIHFVLTEDDGGVIPFVKELEKRIRHIKTTVASHKKEYRSEIRGRISWKDTISTRLTGNPKDKSIFVCVERERNYNIPENLVLKKLLQVIHDIVYTDLKVAADNQYDWFNEGKLQPILNEVFLKNVYLRRINLENVRITERMIERAKRSRHPLYREAAVLLERYRKLMNYDMDENEAKELLKNTFIKPKKDDVLFELYWVIRIMNEFKSIDSFKWKERKLIEPGLNEIAKGRYENGDNKYEYIVYHNSTGSLRFYEEITGMKKYLLNKDNYLGRELRAIEKLNELIDKNTYGLWGGRPDIVIEKRDENGNLKSVFLAEVKYTDKKEYAMEGLKELLEYVALLKKSNGEYLEGYDSLFKGVVSGALFTGQVEDFLIKEDVNLNKRISLVMFKKEEKNKIMKRIVEPLLD